MKGQLKESIASDYKNKIVAYEPVWAIGTGKNCDLDKVIEISNLTKSLFAEDTAFIYGGSVNKDNIKDALAKAKDFKNVVITVDNHTIVKLDVNDCKPSSAWSACMPKAEGYIKKGDLVYQNDYANNIIGLPDGQERLLFLFD